MFQFDNNWLGSTSFSYLATSGKLNEVHNDYKTDNIMLENEIKPLIMLQYSVME